MGRTADRGAKGVAARKWRCGLSITCAWRGVVRQGGGHGWRAGAGRDGGAKRGSFVGSALADGARPTTWKLLPRQGDSSPSRSAHLRAVASDRARIPIRGRTPICHHCRGALTKADSVQFSLRSHRPDEHALRILASRTFNPKPQQHPRQHIIQPFDLHVAQFDQPQPVLRVDRLFEVKEGNRSN